MTVPSTATLEDLFLETHLSSSMLTREEVENEVQAFRALSPREQSREVARQLTFLAQEGTAPCILDQGAMLDSAGKYAPEYADVLDDFLKVRDVYLCLVHTRSPDFQDLSVRGHILDRRLRALAPPDAQALVARLLRDANISAPPDKTARLGEVTGGYPPAAYFLVSQIEDYGIDVVLGDASRVVDFNTRSFSRLLRDLKLPTVEREILIYLASETKLSLSGIASATGHSIERTSAAIRQLVDLSIVDVQEDEYSVAGPIQTTVLRNEDGLGRRWYERAFQRLEAEYWADERALPPISVVDATLRARFRIGLKNIREYGSLVRPSLLINAAQEMYHRRDYAGALEYLDRAEAMGGGTPQLLEVRIKSLAQLRRFSEARAALRRYRESGERRQWYLDGFVERKAGDHQQASTKFQRGYARGDRSISLLRDYADSLLRTDALSEAGGIAREALAREPGNIYLLDLVARIEIAGGTRQAAEEALDALEAADVDEQLILLRRASYLLYRRGNAEAVRRAVALAERATAKRDAAFEAFLVLARALVRAKAWDRLDEVKAEIAKRRNQETRDVLRGLDLEVAIAAGEWRRAEQLLPRNVKTVDDRQLVAAVLDLKSVDQSVLLHERQEASAEASRLRKADDRPAARPPLDVDLYE